MPTIDTTLNYCKLTKIISMYEKIIYIKIDEWKSEQDTKQKKEIEGEIYELIDMVHTLE